MPLDLISTNYPLPALPDSAYAQDAVELECKLAGPLPWWLLVLAVPVGSAAGAVAALVLR